MGNSILTPNPEKENDSDNEEYILPQGTKYEKELSLNFKYFNIFWFDPNKSEDYKNYKKCFKNVQFYIEFDIESTINFFNKDSYYDEWIVITPGSKGEELISKLHENQSIRAFLIFCFKPELHEKWIKKYEKVKCLTNESEILCQKLINLNENYLIPNFIYDEQKKKKMDFYLNFNDLKSENKYSLKSVIRENKELLESISKNKNKYNIFCMKTLYYLKQENCLYDFQETIKKENAVFHKYIENIKFEETERLKKIINFVKNVTLISLYFSQYKYLFNLFSYNEIKKILMDDITPKIYMKLYNEKVFEISEKLYGKLMKNESILNEKEDLKQIQTFAILLTFFGLSRHRNKDFIEFYQIINFYRDIDFSLKLLILYVYLIFDEDEEKNLKNNLCLAFSFCDFRPTRIFLEYADTCSKDFKLYLNKEDQKNLDESLTIKDFLVIGDKYFHEKIQNIQKNINIQTIKYLTKIDEIPSYIKNKNIIDSRKEDDNRLTFFYYLIIKAEDFHKNFEKICLISAELALSFIALVYIEDENEILFNKMLVTMVLNLTSILVYSPEDIVKYLSKKINFNFIENVKEILEKDPKLLEFLKVPIPKINFDKNNNEDYQDGCFELAETFDVNLIKNKIIRIITDNIIDMASICYNLYLSYNENNALNLFYKYNCRYYGFSIDPEIIYLEISAIKRILYMYCREELEYKKSFYYILNFDLRTRNPTKIYRYLDIIALINKLIENEELASFKGKVYRATKLEENLIFKIEPGSTMVNTTFWSTSKDFEVAENFLKEQSWRNTFIYCDTFKNNIDIDFENLNMFSEKEILFLPFTEFRVEKIIIEKKYGRKIFSIQLTELGTKNSVNLNNMQIININDMNYINFYEKINEEK